MRLRGNDINQGFPNSLKIIKSLSLPTQQVVADFRHRQAVLSPYRLEHSFNKLSLLAIVVRLMTIQKVANCRVR